MSNHEANLAIIRAKSRIDTYKAAKAKITDLKAKRAKEAAILDQISEARSVCQTVLANTQASFKADVEDLMTLAIQSVFERFTFNLEWKKMKARTDLNFVIQDGTDDYDLEDDLGGSILDVISFVSRPVFHRYQAEQSRKVLFFDEAFKWIGRGDFQARAGELIQQVSQLKKYQIIFITHEEKYSVIADKAFMVKNNGNRSDVTEMNAEQIGGMI